MVWKSRPRGREPSVNWTGGTEDLPSRSSNLVGARRNSENLRDPITGCRSFGVAMHRPSKITHTRKPIAVKGYEDLLSELKEQIRQARLRAALGVNRELLRLYWRIGRNILDRQQRLGWGAKIIDRLSSDLRREFPGLRGFSARNLRYMRDLAKAWTEEEIWQELLPNCSWHLHCLLLDKVKVRAVREWYLRAAVENGWSGSVLARQIESELHRRHGQAVSNFGRTIPAGQSTLARDLLKDPYCFAFLGIGPDVNERDLQSGLLAHLRDLLVELGCGFAFAGSNVLLRIGEQDFFLDLLFYHYRLQCFVVVELKAVEFQPEFVGKLNFYLSAVDDLLRGPQDRPTVGILVCRTKNGMVAEYSLRDVTKPIGVSTYRLTKELPHSLRSSLPTIEQLVSGLRGKPSAESDD